MAFLLEIQLAAGGWTKPKGNVKTIQAESEASNSNLPFCHLSKNRFIKKNLLKKLIEAQKYKPISQRSPKWCREEFNERTSADEKATLSSIHSHLLEVDTHQWKKGAESRIEEEIECFDREEFLVYSSEEQFDDVGTSSDLMSGLLRLRVPEKVIEKVSFLCVKRGQ